MDESHPNSGAPQAGNVIRLAAHRRFRHASDKEDDLALLVACGLAIEEIAERLGTSLDVVYRRLLQLGIELSGEVPTEE